MSRSMVSSIFGSASYGCEYVSTCAVAEIDRLLRVEFFLLRAIEQRQKKAFEIGRLERLGLDRNKFPLHPH